MWPGGWGRGLLCGEWRTPHGVLEMRARYTHNHNDANWKCRIPSLLESSSHASNPAAAISTTPTASHQLSTFANLPLPLDSPFRSHAPSPLSPTTSHSSVLHETRQPSPQPARKFGKCPSNKGTHLDESNVLALLPEALAAEEEVVFADQTGRVGADAAILRTTSSVSRSHQHSSHRSLSSLPFKKPGGSSAGAEA